MGETAVKYKCLILDHDDTAVDSTASIHYPAHLEMMRRLRPGEPHIDLETWFRKNFDPGIMGYLKDEIGLSLEELDIEYRIWQEFNENRNPPFYEGLPRLLEDFIQSGGILAVVSHSMETHIQRHYRMGAPGVTPHYIFGWTDDENFRKPSPWPVYQILKGTGLAPEEVLVVDDLKPGVEMAHAAGVPVAAAGWGHKVPEIQQQMSRLCHYWLKDIDALRNLLLNGRG